MSPPAESHVLDFLDLSLPDLRRRLQEGRGDAPARLAESLRAEAGRFYHADTAHARRIARRALEVGEISGDPVALGWGERAMAEALLFSGRPAEAEAHYERAAAAWRTSKQAGPLGQLLVGRMGALTLLGRHDRVEEAAAEARRLLERVGDRVYLAKLAMNLGGLRFEREQYGPALEEYDRAAGLFAELGTRDESVIGLEINRGVALSQVDREDEALALFSRLERECEEEGYGLFLAQVRMDAAYVHSQRADYDLALRDLARATEYFRRVEHPAFLGSCTLNRAEIYHQLNLHREALELAREAEPLFAQVGLGHDRALSMAQQALGHLALGRVPETIRSVRGALRLFSRQRNASRVALMELLWAEALSKRRSRRQEAEQRARQAISTFQRLGLLRWEAEAAVLLSELEAERTAPARQIERLREISERVSPRIYPIPAYRLLEALGGAQERAGMLRAAETTYRRALGHLEDLRVRIPTEDSKIAFLRDKAHLYDRMLAIELARGRPSIERIFEWMERSRAQSLWDRMRTPSSYLGGGSAEGAGGTPQPMETMRRRLSWMHARLSRLELGTSAEREQAAILRRALAEAEKGWSRMLREAGESSPSRRRAHPDDPGRGESERPTVPGVSEIERRLPAGWGFASYHLGPDFGLVVVVTERGSAWRPLRADLRKRLAALSERLDFQWGSMAVMAVRRDQALQAGATLPQILEVSERALRRSTDAVLRQIHALIWRPIEELGAVGIHHWILSPHGPIHRVPFAALCDGSGYLIERADLCAVPSARVWGQLPRPASEVSGRAWVAGVPSPKLPGVEAELARVQERLAGWACQVDAAPAGEAFRLQATTSSLVHLAAHGALRADNPAFSFVELADGPLFVHDLGRSRFPGSTVVLTACSSGRGAAPAGEEWIGLARGFLQAGAGTVVASLWAIHEAPTLALMDAFYEQIAAGAGVPQALGSAMRERIPYVRHPWEWAAFGVLGGVWMRGARGYDDQSIFAATPGGRHAANGSQ